MFLKLLRFPSYIPVLCRRDAREDRLANVFAVQRMNADNRRVKRQELIDYGVMGLVLLVLAAAVTGARWLVKALGF